MLDVCPAAARGIMLTCNQLHNPHPYRSTFVKDLSPAELAAVLTGLRLLQDTIQSDVDFPISDLYMMVFTGDGAHDPLSVDEIETLCQRLN